MKFPRNISIGILVLLLSMNAVYAQAIQTITCPKVSPYKCVASNETCGWRNERPTAAELESAKHGGLELAFSCPTLPNGIEMELCWIDRKNYCKAPSPADIARAEKAKREHEEKARQEKLAAERKKAEIAREIAILGPHREAEARRLVEMRERAEAARRGNGMMPAGNPSDTAAAKTPADTHPKCLRRGNTGWGSGRSRQEAILGVSAEANMVCNFSGFTLTGTMECRQAPFGKMECRSGYACKTYKTECTKNLGTGTAQ